MESIFWRTDAGLKEWKRLHKRKEGRTMITDAQKKFDGMTLTQDAYPATGSFPVKNGAAYNGSWYEAHAVDGNGNEYKVRWTEVDWDAEDGADACDWDNPDYIQAL